MKSKPIYLPLGTALVPVLDEDQLGCDLCFFKNNSNSSSCFLCSEEDRPDISKVIYKLIVLEDE